MDDERFDVIQVGYGPGGQALTALLRTLGDRVLAVERHADPYNLPRAGHIDHEVVRTVQAVGEASVLEPKLWKVSGDYVYVNGDYDVLMSHPIDVEERSISGWHSDYTLYQPDLEDAFNAAVARLGGELALGWDLVDVEQSDDEVVARLRRVQYTEGRRTDLDEWRTVRARYLVAADGASSFVRRALGIGQEDMGFDERFLVVDMLTVGEHVFDPNMAQVCDPARPRMLIPLGPRHRRFEFALRSQDTTEEMERPETAWKLLSEWGVTPETHRIVRQLVYQFQARVAERFREGRILLAGDAAHTMPPFAGQGLCSAVRDACNLGWKLHLVLRGDAPDRLLGTYEPERRPHVLAWTAISIAEGQVNCVWDPAEAHERDLRFKAGWRPPVYDLPKLTAGVLSPRAHPLVGDLCLQAPVKSDSGTGLLEDLVPGYRFNLLVLGVDPHELLQPEARMVVTKLGGNIIQLVPAGSPADGAFEDVTGAYQSWFAEHQIIALLERPDFYVFGVAGTAEELSQLPLELDEALAR